MTELLIILADGFEETEAVTIIDLLRRANLQVISAGLTDTMVEGAHSITIQADTTLAQVAGQTFSAVILPGGMGGTERLLNSPQVIDLLKRHAAAGKVTAAICAAPWVLEKAQLLDGKQATIYPGLEDKLTSTSLTSPERVVEDGQVITSKGPGTAMDFALALVAKFAGPAMADQVATGLLYEGGKI